MAGYYYYLAIEQVNLGRHCAAAVERQSLSNFLCYVLANALCGKLFRAWCCHHAANYLCYRAVSPLHTYSKPRLSRKLKIKSKPCGRGACGQKSMKRPGASWWGKWSLKAVYASRHSHSRRRSLKPSDHWGVSDRRSPPSRPSQPSQPPARWSATAQAAWTDDWHPAVDKNQKRQLPSSPSSALWLQVFTTVYGMIIGASEEAPIMIYRGRSFRPLCGQVTKRDKWPGICAKCFIYY